MRLKSEIWVKAYLRVAAAGGCPGVVARHGDDEAGAIFIKVSRLDGTALLFGPAPAGFDGVDQERKWIPWHRSATAPEAEVDAVMEREAKYDSDLWLIEIESPRGTHFLDSWLLATPP